MNIGTKLGKWFIWEAQERGKVAKTLWDDVETTTNGTQLVKKMFDGVSMREKPTEYPAFYMYNPPLDYHECGSWLKIDKIKFRLGIEKRIEEYKEYINFLKKTLDKVD